MPTSNQPHSFQAEDLQSVKGKLIALPFSLFYFINWYYIDRPWPVHLVLALAFAVFMIAYLFPYQSEKKALWGYGSLIAMAFAISPLNPGANSFAIFACAASAYTLKPRITIYFVVASVILYAGMTLWMDYPWIGYFIVSCIVTFAVCITGHGQQTLMHSAFREQADREEVHRLSKLSEHDRIGQDMHDLLGHSLTSIHLKAKLATKLLGMNDAEKAAVHLQDIEHSVQKAMTDVRRAVLKYKTLSLQEELISQKEYLQKLGIDLILAAPALNLPNRLENDLVMLVREAINNTLKYAKASKIQLTLAKTEGNLELTIHDNGKGMQDKPGMAHQGGSGLDGMKQRTESHGGQITFSNDKGFKIDITIPLMENAA